MSFRIVMPALCMAAALSVPSAFAEETGTIKVQFKYGGSAFDPAAIDVNKDVDFCGKHPLVNEKLLVDKATNGIKNVVLYVHTGKGGSKLPAMTLVSKKVTLANDKCRFEPRVVILAVGDTLEITNPDAVGHNANVNFFANAPVNPLIPPNAAKEIMIVKPEPGVISVDCNIHPWMRAYTVVLDHPFAGVSDAEGMIEIKGLPSGAKLVFRIFHEGAGSAIKEVMIGGKPEALKKNLIELMVNPGMNDLGTITIPADALKP